MSVAVGLFAPLVGYGLRHILCEDRSIRMVGFDLDLAALEVAVADYAAQVVILDESSVSGASVLARLRAGRADLGVLVLAHSPSRAYCLRVLGLGARACLSKDAPVAEILSAVCVVAEGKQLLAFAHEQPGAVGELVGVLSLTAREREVLELLSVGLSNAEIALELRVAVETVRTHVAHIYRKLGVNGRRELVGVGLPSRGSGDGRGMRAARDGSASSNGARVRS